MTYLGNEETLVKLPAVKYLEKNLEYSFINGKDLITESGARDSFVYVIIVNRLREALRRYMDARDEYLEEGITKLF
ncbi:hypothetical protein MF669_002478 [Clostridium perfringens]|nr:hypothetical protein [Clostridium perfringens]